MTFEFVLAAALLTAEPDQPIPAMDCIELLRPSILALAIDAEIIDPREKNFLLIQNIPQDIAMLQKRNEELLSMPHLGEVKNFSNRKTINELLTINRSFKNDLQKRLEIDLVHENEIRNAIIETDQLYQAWDCLRDAQCDYYYVSVRRQALGLYKSLVGDRSFYSGEFIPYIPFWHIAKN